jgi:hypothetical protein
VDVELLGWVCLHDLDDTDSIGLKRRDGANKLAYDVWETMQRRKRRPPEITRWLPVLEERVKNKSRLRC